MSRELGESTVCLQAYGFRNIQTLVQKMKRHACDYDFVEIMACPSGCLNGGGQVGAPVHDMMHLGSGVCLHQCCLVTCIGNQRAGHKTGCRHL